MSVGVERSLTAATRDALACEASRKGSGGCSPGGAMSAEQRHMLALFTCARAMHRGVSVATIAEETGLRETQVAAVMNKGSSSACTREAMAMWNELEFVRVHGRAALRPVLHKRDAGALSSGHPCGVDADIAPHNSGGGV